ncbi:hypothetical protein ACP70R_013226 [Stipagrostis hirtigluma subsp. patula]
MSRHLQATYDGCLRQSSASLMWSAATEMRLANNITSVVSR